MISTIQKDRIKILQIDIRYWVWFAILLSAFIFSFIKAFAILFSIWWNSYIYSYGFLIPLVSLYTIWIQREKLKYIQPAPNFLLGAPLLLIGLFILISDIHGSASVKVFSLIIAIIGMVLLVLGKGFLKVLSFPIAYLLFTVPFWDNLTERLDLLFQNFTAIISIHLMQFIGIPAYKQSLYIELPNVTLEVAKECSGTNNLIAIIAIAIPLAYINLRSWSRRILFICIGVVIAIVGNGLRVALIGLFAYHGFSKVLHGPYHIFQAMSVSIIGFILLFLGVWILAKGDKSSMVHSAPVSFSLPPHIPFQWDIIKYPLCITSGILILVGIFNNFYK